MVRVIVLMLSMMATAAAALPLTYIEIIDDNTAVEVYDLELSKRTIRTKYAAWNKLCLELRDIDCTGVSVPEVKTFRKRLDRPGLLGFYKGGDTIFVRTGLGVKRLEEVLAHEMSHYFDTMVLGLEVPGYAKPICFSEKRAWAVSDAYNRMYGNKKDIVGETWVDWYNHCKPFRDEMYPKG